MFSLGGNPTNDTNFFSQDFTNHVPPPTDVDTAKELLEKKFATSTDYIRELGVSDMA